MFAYKDPIRVILILVFIGCLPIVGKAESSKPSVTKFASLPDVSSMSLSPDGTKMLFQVRLKMLESKDIALYMTDLESGQSKAFFKSDNKKFVVNWVSWASNNKVLVSARFPAVRFGTPTTETRLMVIDVETGKIRGALSKTFLRRHNWVPQFQDNIIDLLKSEDNKILVGLRLQGAVGSQVIKLDLSTGIGRTEERNRKDVFDWVTDRQERVRLHKYFKDTNHRVAVRSVGEKKWRTLWEYETFSEDSVTPLGFDNDPNILFFVAYHRGFKAVYKTNLNGEPGNKELVYSEDSYDVSGRLIYSKKSKQVVGINKGRDNGFVFWAPEYKNMQRALDKVLPKTTNVFFSLSDDETKAIVLASSSTDPGTYYLWDRTRKTLDFLAKRYDGLTPSDMVEPKWVSYKARDGLEIEALLTRPNTDTPGPTIIFPHGGPISHDRKGFDYWTQFFVSRGYNVLQMNFRGSSGYGHEFMKSGLKGWGLEMQQDVEDGTKWMIQQGVADPQKICIVGASYGGYAAMMEASSGSGLYQCAVSFAGVMDIPALVKAKRRFTNHKVAEKQIGNDFKDLRKRSPVSRAAKFDIPVLLVHGTKDRVVKSTQSKKLAKLLKKNNKQFKYVEQKDGTHYLSRERNRLELFMEMDSFLANHLL